MKKYLKYSLLVMLVFFCFIYILYFGKNNYSHRNRLNIYEIVHHQNTMQSQAEASEAEIITEEKTGELFTPDTSIGQLSLLNASNVEAYLGLDWKERISGDIFKVLSVSNRDSSELCLIHWHPGSRVNEFSEFEIKYNEKQLHYYRVGDKNFKTESGIKLGISTHQVKALKGNPDSIFSNNDLQLFHYYIKKNQSSSFLDRYNLPLYYARYKFKNDSLIWFKFGFEYP